MILNKYVKTTWNPANREYLEKQGYVFTRYKSEVEVLMEDINPSSNIKIEAECEKCGKIFTRSRRKLDINNCLCYECSRQKTFDSKRKKCKKCGAFVTRPKDNDYCGRCKITQYTRNDYEIIDENTVKLFTRNRDNKINGFTLIDKEDLEKVVQYKWRNTGRYIKGGEGNSNWLHRFVMNCKNSDNDIDHINHNTYDNRKKNLRIVTRKENCNNRRGIGNLRYATIKDNDTANGEGVVVSFWTQGCEHHCKNCFNKETWDFEGGKVYDRTIRQKVLDSIDKNGIIRNFSVLGGDPLAPRNIDVTLDVVSAVRRKFPDIKIYLWTGYLFDEIEDEKTKFILHYIDILIDGKFEEDKKDISLKMRGSTNQRIIDVKESLKENKVILYNK